MPPKSFLVANDQVIFQPTLMGGGILMAPAMTVVVSKSKNTATKRGITVEGDEKQWIVVACPYTKPPYVIPGIVMCKIKKLHDSNIAKKIKENKKSVLLVGSAPFDAEFQVTKPAQQPPPVVGDGSPDPSPKYDGKGQFIQAMDSKSTNKG